MTVRGVLFDVGNVIVRWDPRTLYRKLIPDHAERERFLTEVATPEWHLNHDRGVSYRENGDRLIARFPEHEALIRAWRERWWEMFSGTFPETEAAIEALHARAVPLFALTNMSNEVVDGVFAMSPVFKYFRETVVSAAEGFVKPDPRLYAVVTERTGFAPSDLLFIDDNADNIEAARALGYDVHWFVDPAALRPALEARGLL